MPKLPKVVRQPIWTFVQVCEYLATLGLVRTKDGCEIFGRSLGAGFLQGGGLHIQSFDCRVLFFN